MLTIARPYIQHTAAFAGGIALDPPPDVADHGVCVSSGHVPITDTWTPSGVLFNGAAVTVSFCGRCAALYWEPV